MDRDDLRDHVHEMCRAAREQGEPCGWFESLYRESEGDVDLVPWADGAANAHFLAGMGRPGMPTGGRALVVGCGFGDDAEALAGMGFEVTAFDVSASAIDWCRRKHPDSLVGYEVGDVFAPPDRHRRAFDLVLEVYTLQAIPLPHRTAGFAPLADCVAPGGVLLAVMRGRDDDAPVEHQGPPWPISRAECLGFQEAGLELESWEDFLDEESPRNRRFRMVWRRAPN